MCFGVRDALKSAEAAAARGPAVILGQLAHNPAVSARLKTLGLREGRLEDAPEAAAPAPEVIITAHGASDLDRARWRESGLRVTDTTCPLVKKAHTALARLVAEGRRPVVIGQAGHVEVRGLTGDFPGAAVVLSEADVAALPFSPAFGVISQTTQPLALALRLVERLRARHPEADVVFRDTVCQPTKDRQAALEALCRGNDTVVVIGGRNSNNTRQLTETARSFGVTVRQVESAEELREEWFRAEGRVGVTAGTSTPPETVEAVAARLRMIGSAVMAAAV